VSAVPTLGRPRTRQEAATFLRCSVPTLDRRIKAGLLGCVRNGRLVLILDEHLEAFLARDTATTPAPVRTGPRRHPKYAARAAY
jgi:excisionase family DNA binding protein